MENIIYYFSGRGNSLSVAQELARRLENVRICPMASFKGPAALAGEWVGLIMPVIDFGIPAYVRRFVGRLCAAGNHPYVFSVITCGGMPGKPLHTVGRLLHKHGIKLAAGWVLQFGRTVMTEGEWRLKMNEMAKSIREREKVSLPSATLADHMMTGVLNPIARLLIPNEDKKFRVSGSCTGCGTCTRVCPVNNIHIKNGKPVWHHQCEQCAACFSWCPQEAISGTCLAAKTHYRNPRVKLDQLYCNEGSMPV